METQAIHTQAKEAGDQAQEAWKHVADYTEVVESLKVARKNEDWCQKHLKDLSHDLKERTESDEWLQKELDQYEERIKIHQSRQQEQAKRYERLNQEISQIRKDQSDKSVEAGKHEQRKATYEQKIRDREADIKKSAREHNIRGYDGELDDMEIGEYMDRIVKMSKDQNAKVERLRRDNMNEIQKVQDILDALRERRSALQEGKKSTKDQLLNNDRRTGNLHSELKAIAMDEGGKVALESSIEELEARLKKAKQELRSNGWETKTQQANTEIRSLEDRSAALNRELIQGTKQAGNMARLDHLKKESKDRQRSLETMTGAHGDRLRSTVGRDWKVESLERDFQHVMDTKRRAVVDAERQRDGVNRELEQVEFKLKTIRSDTKRKEKELESSAQVIRENIQGEPEDYPDTLAAIQSDRDTRKYDVDGYAILKKWYGDCMEVARSDEPACRLCARPFHDERSLKQFIQKLEKQVSKAAFEALQKELKELDGELQKAKDAGPSYDTWIRLSDTELPALKAEVAKLEQQRESLLRHIEEHDKVVDEKEEARRDAETLSNAVANITKYSSEHASYQSQIKELVAKQQDPELARTLEDIQEEIESVSTKSRMLRNDLAKLQADEKRGREQISDLEVELGKSKSKLMTANHELEKREKLISQIEDMKKSNKEQRDSIKELDYELETLAPQFSEQEAKRDDIKQRGEQKERELQQEATSLSDSVRHLRRADQEIRAYIEDGGPAKLARCHRDIQSFEQDIAQLEVEIKQITVEINRIREELSNQDQTKRIITDNLKYRKTRHELDAVKAEISRLSAQNAEADQEYHRKEADKWQRKHNKLSMDETSMMATMKAKDDQLMQLIKDWNTDYHDAAAKYRKTHIQVEVRILLRPLYVNYIAKAPDRLQKRQWRTLVGMAAHLTSMQTLCYASGHMLTMTQGHHEVSWPQNGGNQPKRRGALEAHLPRN